MEKQKNKIHFLGFNLFYCLPYGLITFIGIDVLFGLQTHMSLLLTLYFYFIDVNQNTSEDFMKYKIEQLEERINNKLTLKRDANI